MSLDDAFSLFISRAVNRGLTDITEHKHPEVFGSRYINISHQNGVLRLVFDGKDDVLTLEINHGPTDDPILWLDLYQAPCRGGKLLAGKQEDVSFESAVDYGLDLMQPEHSAGAA